MTRSLPTLAASTCVLALVACSQPTSDTNADAGAPAPAPAGTTYESLASLPDFAGPWALDPAADPAHSTDVIPFTPEYATKLDTVRKMVAGGKPVPAVQARCVPNGMPTMMYIEGAMYQFLLTPGRFTVVTDTHDVRRAYTDGRKHPEDPDNSYGGDGVAHWEKDTLVVDTIGLLPELPVVPGVQGGGKVHVVERIHLTGPDKLEIATTLTDDSLSAPYSYTRTYTRHRGANMEENICLPEPDLKL